MADLRLFDASVPRLNLPRWDDQLSPDHDFVRYIGGLRARLNDGFWIGNADESELIHAKQAFKFAVNHSLHHQEAVMPSVFECAYRRFYFDGFAAAKFEIALSDDKNNREGKRAKDGITGALLPYRDTYTLTDLVRDFLRMQMQIRDPFGHKTDLVEIGRASKALGRLYLAGSTPHNQLQTVTDKFSWVEPGTPLLLVTYDRDVTRLTLPAQLQAVALPASVQARQVGLHHYTLVTAFGARRMWVMSYSVESDRTFIRNLRIHLTQLHVEHESIRRVLSLLRTNRLLTGTATANTQQVQAYLDSITRDLSQLEHRRNRRFGADLTDLVRISQDIFNRDDIDAVQQVMRELGFRPQLQSKVTRYLNQWEATQQTNLQTDPLGEIKVALRNAMVAAFSLSELESLCLDLKQNIIWQDIARQGITDSVLQLIAYCERRDLLNDLIAQCKQARPSISWPTLELILS